MRFSKSASSSWVYCSWDHQSAAMRSAKVGDGGGGGGVVGALPGGREGTRGVGGGEEEGVLAWWRGLLEPAVIKWILPRTEHQIAPAKSTQALKCKR